MQICGVLCREVTRPVPISTRGRFRQMPPPINQPAPQVPAIVRTIMAGKSNRSRALVPARRPRSTGFRFLALPAEIRLRILSLLLTKDTPLNSDYLIAKENALLPSDNKRHRANLPPSIEISLLRVSRQLYNEGRQLIFKNTIFTRIEARPRRIIAMAACL